MRRRFLPDPRNAVHPWRKNHPLARAAAVDRGRERGAHTEPARNAAPIDGRVIHLHILDGKHQIRLQPVAVAGIGGYARAGRQQVRPGGQAPGLQNSGKLLIVIPQADEGETALKGTGAGAANEFQPLIQGRFGQQALAHHGGQGILVTQVGGFALTDLLFQLDALAHHQGHGPDGDEGKTPVRPHSRHRNACVRQQGGGQDGECGGYHSGDQDYASAEPAGQQNDGRIAYPVDHAARLGDVEFEQQGAGQRDSQAESKIKGLPGLAVFAKVARP